MVRSVVACVCLLFSIQTIFASPEIRGWRGVDSETLESLHPRAKIFEHHNELAQIEEEVLQGIKNFDRDWAGRNIFVVRFNYLVLDEETQQYELEKVLDEDLVYDSSSANITSVNGIKRFIGSKLQENLLSMLKYVNSEDTDTSTKQAVSKQKHTDNQRKVNSSYMDSYESFDSFSDISELREKLKEYENRFSGSVHFFDFNTTQDEIDKSFRALLNYTEKLPELNKQNERLKLTFNTVSEEFSRKAEEKYTEVNDAYQREFTGISATLADLRDHANPLKYKEEDYFKRVRAAEKEFDAFRRRLDFDAIRRNEVLYQLWHSEQKFIGDLRRQFNLPEANRFFKVREQRAGKKRVFFMINIHSRFDICGDTCGPGLLATCSPFGEFAEKIREHFRTDFALVSSFRQFRNQWTSQEVEDFKKEAASDIREEKLPYFPAFYVGNYSEVQSGDDTVNE